MARTLMRGQTVYADGEIRVEAGFGRFLSGRYDYGRPGPMSFRLSVINPNSDPAVTGYLRAATARVLPDGSAVDAVDIPESPSMIETALDDVLAAPAVVAAPVRVRACGVNHCDLDSPPGQPARPTATGTRLSRGGSAGCR